MENELLPCPFCGSEHIRIHKAEILAYYVKCEVCEMGSVFQSTERDAANVWNTRITRPGNAAPNGEEPLDSIKEQAKDVRETHGCKCDYCGNRYKVDILIPDELWARLHADEDLLCGECLIRRIEHVSDFSAYRLSPIVVNFPGENQ